MQLCREQSPFASLGANAKRFHRILKDGNQVYKLKISHDVVMLTICLFANTLQCQNPLQPKTVFNSIAFVESMANVERQRYVGFVTRCMNASSLQTYRHICIKYQLLHSYRPCCRFWLKSYEPVSVYVGLVLGYRPKTLRTNNFAPRSETTALLAELTNTEALGVMSIMLSLTMSKVRIICSFKSNLWLCWPCDDCCRINHHCAEISAMCASSALGY